MRASPSWLFDASARNWEKSATNGRRRFAGHRANSEVNYTVHRGTHSVELGVGDTSATCSRIFSSHFPPKPGAGFFELPETRFSIKWQKFLIFGCFWHAVLDYLEGRSQGHALQTDIVIGQVQISQSCDSLKENTDFSANSIIIINTFIRQRQTALAKNGNNKNSNKR